jgi:hypothetical protein
MRLHLGLEAGRQLGAVPFSWHNVSATNRGRSEVSPNQCDGFRRLARMFFCALLVDTPVI